MNQSLLSQLKKLIIPLFFFLVVVFIVTCFTQNNLRKISKIVPEVFSEPIQNDPANEDVINFEKNDVNFELEVIQEYEINGIVVSKNSFNHWYSVKKSDQVWQFDFCIIWGSNAENEVYKDKNIEFENDMGAGRYCIYRWKKQPKYFNEEELSNNHLLINNSSIEKIAKTVKVGDQIKIKGKLVDGVTQESGKMYTTSFATSTSRTDTGFNGNRPGAGACEIIYVENIEILKRGNPISYLLNKISYWGIIIIIIFSVVNFFISSHKEYEKVSNKKDISELEDNLKEV